MTDKEVYAQVANDYVVRGVKAIRQSKKWAKLSGIPLIGRFALRKAGDLADEAHMCLELSSKATLKVLMSED